MLVFCSGDCIARFFSFDLDRYSHNFHNFCLWHNRALRLSFLRLGRYTNQMQKILRMRNRDVPRH